MSPIAQNVRVRAVIGKKWLENVAADVLDLVEQLTAYHQSLRPDGRL